MTLLQRYRLRGYSANTTAIEMMSPEIETLKKHQTEIDLIGFFIMRFYELVFGLLDDDMEALSTFEAVFGSTGFSDEPFIYTKDGHPYSLHAHFLNRQLNIRNFITQNDHTISPHWREIIDALSIISETVDFIVPEGVATQEIKSRENQAPENLANENNPEIQKWKGHYLAQVWKEKNKKLFAAMQKAIKINLVNFTGDHFDFICDRGCVGLFFKEAGYTEYKCLNSIVLINGKKPKNTTLQNATSNVPPAQWEEIKNQIFGNNDKILTKY